MTFDQMTFDQMTFDQMTFSQMAFDQMTIDQMTFDQITFDQMSFDLIRVLMQFQALYGPFHKKVKRLRTYTQKGTRPISYFFYTESLEALAWNTTQTDSEDTGTTLT